jgi:hypothetical protein
MSKQPVSRSRRTRGLLASFAAVALGFTGLVALATSASAHHAVVTGTASCQDPNGGFSIDWTVTAVGPSGKTLTAWWDNGTTSGLDIVGGGPAYLMSAGNLFTGSYAGNAVLSDTTYHNVSQVGTGVTLDGKLIWNKDGEGEYEYSVELFVAEPDPCVIDEEPKVVEVDPPADTDPTCDAMGSVEYEDGEGYSWLEPVIVDGVVTLTAVANEGYVITGQSEWVFDLNVLSGEECLEEQPPVEEDPPVEEAPPLVTQTLAETGFPLLGVLGLAGAFSLVGGGLVNARRLLRKNA